MAYSCIQIRLRRCVCFFVVGALLLGLPAPSRAQTSAVLIKVALFAGEKAIEALANAFATKVADKVFDSNSQNDANEAYNQYRVALDKLSAEERANFQDLSAKIEFFRGELNKRVEAERALDTKIEALRARTGASQQEMAKTIAALRSEMEDRTDAERIRGMIRQELGVLEVRTAALEGRQDAISGRIKEIEDRLAFLSTVPPDPAPLISDLNAGDKPDVDPLLKEWAQLLVASEVNRQTLAHLRQTQTESAPKVIAARAEETNLFSRIATLRENLRAQAALAAAERQDLLQKYKPNDPNIRVYDRKIASLLWLIGISRPAPNSDQPGRLAVPRDLLGPKCSDILLAMNLSGVEDRSLVPLFRELVDIPIMGLREGDDESKPPPKLADLEAEAAKFKQEGETLTLTAAHLELDDQAARSIYSDAHPERAAIRAKRDSLLGNATELHASVSTYLDRAYLEYIRELRNIRPNARVMLEFRAKGLVDMERLALLTSGAEPGSQLREETWRQLSAYSDRFDVGRVGLAKVVPMNSETTITLCYIPVADAILKKFSDGKAWDASINRPYWMAQTELSQAQWEAAGGARINPRHRGATLPVENVSYKECEKFVRMLNERKILPSGWEWALPTVAQWQHACHAGITSSGNYNIGGKEKMSLDIGDANFGGKGTTAALPDQEHPYLANNWGLYHMHGNVWEWARDAKICGGSYRKQWSADEPLQLNSNDVSSDVGLRLVVMRTAEETKLTER
jgi:hypothetical protein